MTDLEIRKIAETECPGQRFLSDGTINPYYETWIAGFIAGICKILNYK